MIMGSRVRIRLGAPFDILRFVRNLLFPFFKNSKSDVDDRLRFLHARRRGVVESFSIHTHEVPGSSPGGASNSLPLWENNSCFFFWASYLFWREMLRFIVMNL